MKKLITILVFLLVIASSYGVATEDPDAILFIKKFRDLYDTGWFIEGVDYD